MNLQTISKEQLINNIKQIGISHNIKGLTGNKKDTKTYYWHTGYPGGIKSRVASDMLEGKFPERVIEKAVKRMLPGGPLSRKQMTNLRIYKGESHPHEGQSPEIFKLKDINEKNTRRVR